MSRLRKKIGKGKYADPLIFKEVLKEIFPNPYKTIEEWVAIADDLAKKNNGILQNPKWLEENGFCGLCQCKLRYPEKFFHISQDRKVKSIEEWVKVAEDLSLDNNGILPNRKELDRMGFRQLGECIWKYPKKFSHIKKKKYFKTIREWVAIADDLAKKNNGILPNQVWLRKNGYPQLMEVIKHNRDKFCHIKQLNKKGKKTEYWIKIAKDIAMENNGILPCSRWLNNNGYKTLYHQIYRFPEKFKTMKQEYSGGVRVIGENKK